MYKVLQEMWVNNRQYRPGDLIENVTTRMKDLGIVELVQSEQIKTITLVEDVNPKQEPKPKKKTQKEHIQLNDEVLLDDSSIVEVIYDT
jgi:DNA-binding protein H-NS